jgi:hypothetical protein
MGVSALAVEYIRAGLRGVVVIDRSESSDRGKVDDRQGRATGERDTEDEAA